MDRTSLDSFGALADKALYTHTHALLCDSLTVLDKNRACNEKRSNHGTVAFETRPLPSVAMPRERLTSSR